MLDDDPVIVSEKDFTPTPSSSPAPSADSADETNAPVAGGAAMRDESAVVSEDEDGPEPAPPGPAAATADAAAADARPPPPADDVPSPRQIVSIGTEDDAYAFTYHEDALNDVLAKIPPGWKVCVVSVVGAFRTGKSFLLSWFIRYLEAHDVRRGGATAAAAPDDDWIARVGQLDQKEGSFDWRGGTARNTTGMWMWSEPYFLPRGGAEGDEVAVLLVDTQGMFDHETTVGLTAAIFGLSTLLSSYQIYNVDKRIQEDNLQQLALFSEYGRIAFEAEEKAVALGVVDAAGTDDDGAAPTPAGAPKDAGAPVDETAAAEKAPVEEKAPTHFPFQKIEFLIRDWQNFDTEDEDDVPGMEAEMAAYLAHVVQERAAADLKDTREQIRGCFEEVSCFMLTHPGFAVIKNKYAGDVGRIEPLFLRLLDRYCRRVFDVAGAGGGAPRLGPKTVRGRELGAAELGTYIKAYAAMFEETGARFPKAETMLEATSKANNVNALNASHDLYTALMNATAGPQVNEYHQKADLMAKHREVSEKVLFGFNEMANFGSRGAIIEARDKLVEKMARDYEVFVSLNDGRNPLLGFETYLLPLIVAALSYVLRWVADFSCSGWSQTCRASSEVLSHIYMVVFFFMVIVSATKAKQIAGVFDRVKAAYQAMSGGPSKGKKD